MPRNNNTLRSFSEGVVVSLFLACVCSSPDALAVLVDLEGVLALY
jgi:hypothetical protein